MGRARKTSVIVVFSVLILAVSIMPASLVYARRTYTITASVSGDGGSIAPAGDVPVFNNYDQSFDITAAPGYHFEALFVDGKQINAVPQADENGVITYTFTRVKADHDITAIFDVNAEIELPPGSTAEIEVNVWEDYFNPLLPGIDGITPYFEFVIVEGSFSGEVLVTVHYDDTGLTADQEQNLRLYVGNPVDFDRDGTVNGNDIALIQAEAKSGNPDLDTYDLNNDHVVDTFDINIVKEYANSGLIVNPGQDNAGEFRLPWLDITLGEPDTVNNIIYGSTWHLSLFRCR